MNGNMCKEDVYTFVRTGRVEKLAKPKAILCQSENSKTCILFRWWITITWLNKCQHSFNLNVSEREKSSISFSRNNIVNIMQNILSFSIIKKRNINRQPRKRNTAKPWALWKQHVIYNKCQNISWTVFLILRFAYFWRFLFFEPGASSIQKKALEWESVENSMSMSSVILHCKNLNI